MALPLHDTSILVPEAFGTNALEIALSVSETSGRSSFANGFDAHGHRNYIVGTLRGQTRDSYCPQEARKMAILNIPLITPTLRRNVLGINDSNLLPSFNQNVYDDPRRTSYGLFNPFVQCNSYGI